MREIAHDRIIGIDVSRDYLDLYLLSDGARRRLLNTPAGHERVIEMARASGALVCFEATGGQEWRLWAALDAAGIATRQLLPAQVKAFAVSRGRRAKTDRIDAELIARFMTFRPEAGRTLPHKKLRLLGALIAKRRQLVEMRKRLLMQIGAHEKLATAALFTHMDKEIKSVLERQIAECEARIEKTIAAQEALARTAAILRSIPGMGPVTSATLVAEMPELGHISAGKVAALAGLAPIAHDSGMLRGKRTIGGGRRQLRHVLFQAALVASRHNPVLKAFAEKLRDRGKPHKVIIIAVARKLVTIANALCKSGQQWTAGRLRNTVAR